MFGLFRQTRMIGALCLSVTVGWMKGSAHAFVYEEIRSVSEIAGSGNSPAAKWPTQAVDAEDVANHV